ncbi:tetratricopeptide repeat protein [Fibrella aquatilis]|uniref:Tetratricopeptide repeat protein n=1 Tax=Fibrella aquatilis TaxID=2817059 RepID=A0A939G7W9_9BACT|nr:tetratricopeptide repeat protein [Fibrella aquatilis]MBO0933844.1 tetratricopeptide repeat protein [Fibrella aquatilis]
MSELTIPTTITHKWYDRTWLMIMLSLFVFPFGLYGLWKNRRLHKAWKIVVSVLSPVTTIVTLSIGAYLYGLALSTIYEAEIQYVEASYKYNRKDYRGAIAAYDTLILKHPTYSDAYLMRGNSYDRLGNKRKAIIEYTLAIQFDSSNTSAYFNRGLLNIELTSFKDAIGDFDKVIQFDSLEAKAFYFRGLSNRAINNVTAACNDFNTAQKLKYPEAADALKQYCH